MLTRILFTTPKESNDSKINVAVSASNNSNADGHFLCGRDGVGGRYLIVIIELPYQSDSVDVAEIEFMEVVVIERGEWNIFRGVMFENILHLFCLWFEVHLFGFDETHECTFIPIYFLFELFFLLLLLPSEIILSGLALIISGDWLSAICEVHIAL